MRKKILIDDGWKFHLGDEFTDYLKTKITKGLMMTALRFQRL